MCRRFHRQCLSLENLIDRYSPYIKKTTEKERQEEVRKQTPGLLNVNRDYMSEYINPPAFVKEQKAKQAAEQERAARFPAQPQRDVLEFLMHFAPLQNWQQDVLSIIRDEAYYFCSSGHDENYERRLGLLLAQQNDDRKNYAR